MCTFILHTTQFFSVSLVPLGVDMDNFGQKRSKADMLDTHNKALRNMTE
jgi:hypothetical protein